MLIRGTGGTPTCLHLLPPLPCPPSGDSQLTVTSSWQPRAASGGLPRGVPGNACLPRCDALAGPEALTSPRECGA